MQKERREGGGERERSATETSRVDTRVTESETVSEVKETKGKASVMT